MTVKREAFVDHYLVCWNASEAARRAGYSKKTAASIGEQLLRSPEVIERIEQRKAEIVGDREAIIVKNLTFWLSMVGDPKAKDADRLKASELLGRYAAMFTDKVQLSGPNDEPIQIGITFRHADSDNNPLESP